MNAREKVCLELCQKIFTTFSVSDNTNTVLNYSVKYPLGVDKTAEVILVTKDDTYTFVLDLPEDVCSEIHSHCSKRASENKYNLKSIQIKGYNAVKFGVIDLQYMKTIIEKLAENHAKCIKEDNLENKNYKTSHLFEAEDNKVSFSDSLQTIVDRVGGGSFDRNLLIEGIKTIEDLSERLLTSDEDCVFVNDIILQSKIFIKNSETPVRDCKILNLGKKHHFPLAYDLLLAIFSFTDQNMRQHFFHDLLDHYYESLEKNLEKLSLDIRKCLSTTVFQRQINKFLPCVKLDILKQLCKGLANGNISRESEEKNGIIRTAILEVNECVLFPNLSREDCYEIIRNRIGSSDYIFLSYRLIPLQEREGFLGDYFKLKIEIELDGVFKLLHFFAKYLPTYSELAIDLAAESFGKEEFYYLKFIPQLNTFGLDDITNFLPKCYFSRTNEVLILQDIVMENYRTFSVSESYTYELLSMTIKQLAKIHASSLLYEEVSSEKVKKIVRLNEKYPKYVEEKNILNTEQTRIKTFYDCSIRTFLDMLNVFPDIPKKISMQEFKERCKIQFNLCFEKVKKSDKFRNVLCQGDCWASNILFRTDKNNTPIDCLLVDYQLTRYCPPGHDIYFLFYMTTTKQIRAKFVSMLLHEYYSELSKILERHEVDSEKIYTYQHFLDSCNYMKSQALCHTIMVLQFVMFPEEKLKIILKDKEQTDNMFYKNRDIFIEELQYDGPYGQRMRELAEELYEICENINL